MPWYFAFVDDRRDRFGAWPICRVLSQHGVPIAPNSYYAHRKRAACARTVRDGQVLAEFSRVFHDPMLGRGLCGARKVTAQLPGTAVLTASGCRGRMLSG